MLKGYSIFCSVRFCYFFDIKTFAVTEDRTQGSSNDECRTAIQFPQEFLIFKKWAIPGLFFLYFRLFNTQLTVNKMFNI